MAYILNKRANDKDFVLERSDNTGSLYVTLMDDLVKSVMPEHSIKINREPSEGIDLIVTLNNYGKDFFETVKWVVFVS